MKLRNILIAAATVGFMFASMDRTDVVGYSEGDYYDMMSFPHKVAGENVAWTSGTNFTAVWTDNGTTWGFSGGDADELANMRWSNGTYSLALGLAMTSGTAASGSDAEVAGDTTFDLGFGMNVAGWDVGFGMSTVENSAMTINARGKCNFWAFDTVTFSYEAGGSDDAAWITGGGAAAYSNIDVGMYGVQDWGASTGMFGLGFSSTDTGPTQWTTGDGGWSKLGDGATLINTNFSVESTLTDWCDLRIGYSKTFNMGPEAGEDESFDSYSAGLGFNYGSVQLDMTLEAGALDNMMGNPLYYLNGRSDIDDVTGDAEALAASWTLSYSW